MTLLSYGDLVITPKTFIFISWREGIILFFFFSNSQEQQHSKQLLQNEPNCFFASSKASTLLLSSHKLTIRTFAFKCFASCGNLNHKSFLHEGYLLLQEYLTHQNRHLIMPRIVQTLCLELNLY